MMYCPLGIWHAKQSLRASVRCFPSLCKVRYEAMKCMGERIISRWRAIKLVHKQTNIIVAIRKWDV